MVTVKRTEDHEGLPPCASPTSYRTGNRRRIVSEPAASRPSVIWLFVATIAALFSGLQSRSGLMIENLALRQQLSTVLQKHRPRIGLVDRAFWVVLRRVWARGSDAVVIVKPETVAGWYRAGFALYWRWLSRRRRSPGRAQLRFCPEDGAQERVGGSTDPRGIGEAGVQGLRAHRLALPARLGVHLDEGRAGSRSSGATGR